MCRGSVALVDRGRAGDWFGDVVGKALSVRRFPVPAGGDLGRGPLVPALRAVLPGRRGAAGRTWRHRRSRHRVPVGPAVHPGVHRGGPAVPACSRGPVVCRRDVRQGRRPVDVPVPGDRPARPGHRRAAVRAADLAAARRFFARALRAGTVPAEVTTDRAPAYPRVLDELIPSALHTVERYANNPVETDHGRLKARLRPMRGLKRHRSARILAAGHAFVQNLRRGHYELATESPPATGSAQHSTSSRCPSDQPVISRRAPCHAHRSANATLPGALVRQHADRTGTTIFRQVLTQNPTKSFMWSTGRVRRNRVPGATRVLHTAISSPS